MWGDCRLPTNFLHKRKNEQLQHLPKTSLILYGYPAPAGTHALCVFQLSGQGKYAVAFSAFLCTAVFGNIFTFSFSYSATKNR